MTKSQPERERLFIGGGQASASLQRAGGHPSSGKECAQCGDKNKPEPTRKTQQAMRANTGDNPGHAASRPQNFGHDFSRIQVRSEMEHSSSQIFASQRNAAQLESRSEQVKNKVFLCPPAGDSITAISAATKGGGTLGFTKIDKASQLICSPNFKVDAKAGHCTFDPVAVSLSLTSKFANPTPGAVTSDTLKVPGCGNKDVPIFMEITQAISTLAQQGEQEHCDDLTISFNQTLLPCSTELNKFAGKKIPGKSDAECFKSLKAQMGFDPDDCTLEFADLTKKDDERDSKGFHDFDPVLISKDCNKVLTGNKKSATNKINDPTVAPAKFIPASAKCPKTKAAATAPTTSPTPSPSPSPGGNKPAPAPKSPKKED